MKVDGIAIWLGNPIKTKKELTQLIKESPEEVKFLPVHFSDPLHDSFRTTADHFPLNHIAVIHGPRDKWTASVTRKENKIVVK